MAWTRFVTAVVLVLAGALVGGRALLAQAAPKVAAQIIPPDQEDEFLKGTVSLKTEGLVKPKVKRQKDPKYTPAAMKLGVQGIVTLEAIIGTDGKVEKVRVKTALYPELDQEAVETVKRWEFEPARLYLEPVRVMVEIQMEFRLGVE
jgi:TonB family protein